MDCHPVKASPPAGWLRDCHARNATRTTFWRAIFLLSFFPARRLVAGVPERARRQRMRWSQSNSITRQHAWEGGVLRHYGTVQVSRIGLILLAGNNGCGNAAKNPVSLRRPMPCHANEAKRLHAAEVRSRVLVTPTARESGRRDADGSSVNHLTPAWWQVGRRRGLDRRRAVG